MAELAQKVIDSDRIEILANPCRTACRRSRSGSPISPKRAHSSLGASDFARRGPAETVAYFQEALATEPSLVDRRGPIDKSADRALRAAGAALFPPDSLGLTSEVDP